MPIYALGDAEPTISSSAFIHPDAVIIGSVTIGDNSSVWPCAVLRGDGGEIFLGNGSSVQDGSVLHTTEEWPTTIGDGCTIGHIVHLEGCIVQDRALVGNGAVVLHRALIETGAIVGANAVVTNDTVVPSGALALGVPAKMRAGLASQEMIDHSAQAYRKNCERFKRDLRRID